ncbi:MAG: hypothetical protein IT326_04620, partial [Anaerolineae bacterium]|nr:hypothetical protein [Anaerolineae bacterium]
MMLVWQLLSRYLGLYLDSHNQRTTTLPVLADGIFDVMLAVWRRWDVSHYLQIAYRGYELDSPMQSVFAPLTAWCIRVLDRVIPGPVDVAGLVYGTLVFGLVIAVASRLARLYVGEAGAREVVIL